MKLKMNSMKALGNNNTNITLITIKISLRALEDNLH